MASYNFLFIGTILCFLYFSSLSNARIPNNEEPQPAAPSSLLHAACNATRDPPTCESSLTNSNHTPPANANVVQVIQSALEVCKDNIKTAESMVNGILVESSGNLNRSNAAKQCTELLGYSSYRIQSTIEILPLADKIKDGRAWMSAALAYQYDCWSALKYVNETAKVTETMVFMNSSIGISGNTLAMMWNYDNFGDQTRSWISPKTERDGVWDRIVMQGNLLDLKVGGVPSGLKAYVTVCKNGCDYKTVQEAVNAAPENGALGGKKFVIGIKTGVYEETVQVPLEKKNVAFLGDGIGKTVITGSLNVGQPGMTTYNSATVAVVGDGFMATGVTFQNTAGPDAHQAVAFRSDSDLSIIQNCEFLGNQDTLYAHSMRQYYKSCRIQGSVDFIFGNSAAFFEGCLILVAPRQLNPEKGEKDAVTAHGRIDPAQSTGFVFHDCVINGTSEYMALYYSNPKVHKNYLGRPWKVYSRTVFIKCTLEALITPEGWLPWSGDDGLSTVYYGEFANTGPGANTTARVPWSNQIPPEHVNSYTVQNFIQGNEWLPTSSST